MTLNMSFQCGSITDQNKDNNCIDQKNLPELYRICCNMLRKTVLKVLTDSTENHFHIDININGNAL